MRLGFNGKPAAIRFGFERQGTYFAYLSAYDTELARYAPGKLLLNYCIEEERKRGSTVIDMLAPAGEHKTLWCDEETRSPTTCCRCRSRAQPSPWRASGSGRPPNGAGTICPPPSGAALPAAC